MTFGRPAIIRPLLLALFTRPGQWFRASQMAELSGMQSANVCRTLFKMRQSGHVHMIGGGHFARYYLTEQEAEYGKAEYAKERADAKEASRQLRNAQCRAQWKADHVRKSPAIDRCMDCLKDGMTYDSIATATGVSTHTARHAMTQLVNAGRAFKVSRGNQAAAYYRTEEAAKQAQAERGSKAERRQAKMTPARKAFNDANATPRACLPPTVSAKKPGNREAWGAAPMVIPAGVTVQVLPGFERFGSPWAAKLARAV